MTHTCKNCSKQFEITDPDLKFYNQVSPVFSGKKYGISTPTHCPDCRQQRRLAISNERFLYPGKCGLCKGSTLTEHAPNSNQQYYCRKCWISHEWDPRDHGRDFDFSRPFFEQVLELKRKTPCIALNIQGEVINSEYIHLAGSCKNCLLLTHADFCENCSYGYGFKKNTSCMDGFYNLHCELCYDSVDVHKCYGLTACQECINSQNSAFLRDCIGCKDCFLCVGLRGKQYCFENKQLTKGEYDKKTAEIDTGSYRVYQDCKKRLKELELKHTFKEYHGRNLQNSSGNHLSNCKDTTYSFDCEDIEGGKFLYQIVLGGKNLYDIYQYGTNLQESYECSITGENGYHILFSSDCHISCRDLIYCWYVDRCKNCFGCTNMHDLSFCILNKQYSEEQYNILVSKIIEHMKKTGEWGEFFPMNISLHAYNKSSAQMYYPMTKEEVTNKGLKWDDYESPAPNIKTIATAEQIPDNIKEIPDQISDWAIKCANTGKLYKITPSELKFYRQQRLPIPRLCPDQRHLDRFSRRNPRKFWNRSCAKCQKNITTTYSPGRPETVYCENCYEKTIY